MMTVIGVEVRRIAARRSVRFVMMIVMLGIAIGAVVVFLKSSDQVSEATLMREARARRAEMVGLCIEGHVDAPPAGMSPEGRRAFCEQNFGPVETFVRDPRFHFRSVLPGIEGLAMLMILLGLGLGASFLGADWQSRSMTTLLTWEPRRTRVLLAKLAAFAIVVVAGVVALQAFLALTLLPSALLKGTMDGLDGAWFRSIFGAMARISIMAAVAATVGQVVAAITRNGAAALGSIFLYLALLERMLAGFRPKLTPWLLAENAGIFVTGGDPRIAPGRSFEESTVILAVYTTALILIALRVFRRQEVA